MDTESPHNRPRILFVDDESDILKSLERVLRPQRAAWDMTFVNSPQDALAKQRERPFDVVVSDITMPLMNGLEMALEMRAISPACPVIFLTGTTDIHIAADAINRVNAFRFFTKPCNSDLLAAAITDALRDGRTKKEKPPLSSAAPFAAGSATATVGLAAIDKLRHGLIILDRASRVLFCNRAGAEVLGGRDGLFIDPLNILRATTPAETNDIQDLVARACDADPDRTAPAAISISRPSLKRSLTAFVVPLRPELDATSLAAIFVSDGEQSLGPSPEDIALFFGLSPTEARLAHYLASGLDLESAAKPCGITLSTARTYLKQIFSKTGTNKQSELLKLILTTPPIA